MVPGLYDRIRKSAGVEKLVDQYPVELITAEDSDYMICAIACCFFNVWGFQIVAPDGGLTVVHSHDEVLCIGGSNSKKRAETEELLLDFGLPPLL